MWHECRRNSDYFQKKHSDLKKKEVIRYADSYEEPSASRGRPPKQFLLLTDQMKKRCLTDVLAEYTVDELEFALKCLKKRKQEERPSCMSIETALCLYIELDLSVQKYNVLRKTINELQENFMPSFYAMHKYKKTITPTVAAAENFAEVKLKALLKQTSSSIMSLCKELPDKVTLICKWGMDGSSGHSRYKQTFSSPEVTDEFIFVIALTPIKLINSTSEEEIWSNEKCSSTFSCRPVKFLMQKEDKNVIQRQYDLMEEQIRNLEIDVFDFNAKVVEVSYDMHCTMIDGAVTNILTGTNSSSRCSICGATPNEMNGITLVRTPNINYYKFGLSTLHCWIRFLECLLKIAYRLPIKKWQVRLEDHNIVAENKIRIQTAFREDLGLLIDCVKQGCGTTNDGNTARKFFHNFKKSAEITGLNEDVIYNFGLVLKILSCSKKIKIVEFGTLLSDTRNLYLELYKWYKMPSSVHKVLFHGCDIIKYFDMPIGLLSEEALEASHKMIRRNRLSHTRRISRENSNKDLMTHMIISSDPKFFNLRKSKFNNQYSEEDPYMEYYIFNEEN